MASKVVLLEQENLCKVHQSGCQEVRHSLPKVKQEYLINCVCATRLDHHLQSLLRELNNLLECLVQLDFGELMRTLDHGHWLLCPVFVHLCLASNFILPFLTHPRNILVPFLTLANQTIVEPVWMLTKQRIRLMPKLLRSQQN